MSDQIQILFYFVLRSSLFLAIAAAFVAVAIRSLRIQSSKLQRVAWGLVLLQSCWVIHWSVELPLHQYVSHWNQIASSLDAANRKKPSLNDSGPQDRQSPYAAESYVSDKVGVTAVDIDENFETILVAMPSQYSYRDREETSEVRGAHDNADFDTNQPASNEKHSSAKVDLLAEPLGVIPFHAIFPLWTELPRYFAWLWIVGLVALVTRELFRFVMFQFSLHAVVPARDAWNAEWKQLLQLSSVSKSIPIFEHERLGPMLTVRLGEKVVVVPSDYWEELTSLQRLTILQHELAHWQRNDVEWSLLARILAWPQWFNPFAWMALRRFDECAEWCCDERLKKCFANSLTEYAKALVVLIESPVSNTYAASHARGSSISTRIRRLLVDERRETTIARGVFAFAIAALCVIGLIRVEIFSGSPASAALTSWIGTSHLSDDDQNKQRIEQFRNALEAPDEPTTLLARFKACLATDSGRLVISERALNEENALRQQAEQEPNPLYVAEYLIRSGDRFTIQPQKMEAVLALVSQWKALNEHLKGIGPFLKESARKLDDSSEANSLLKRCLTDESSLTLLYLDRFHDRLSPDLRTVRERMNEVFVMDRDSKWILRPGAKDQVGEWTRQLERSSKFATRLEHELLEWKRDLSKSHVLSRRVYEAMEDPLHAQIVAIASMNEDYGIDRKIDQFFENLESMFIDRADGLVPNEEREDEIREGLNRFDAIRALAEKLECPAKQFGEQIRLDDPLAERWSRVLNSPMGSVWLATGLEPVGSDPIQQAREMMNQWTSASDGDRLTVNAEHQEEVTNVTRDLLRETRSIRRRVRELDSTATQLDHDELRQCLESFAGKGLVVRAVQDVIARRYFDGFGAWVENHFDKDGAGYHLKDGQEFEVESFLEQVDGIQKELAQDDF